MNVLVLYIRLHDGCYHGQGDWPPSPFRVFQALIAGAGICGPLGNNERDALTWLEQQNPPIVAVPFHVRAKQQVLFYMPNNDSDRIEGDAQRIAKIRTATKVFQPYLFEPEISFIYAWPLAAAEDDGPARAICALAKSLYQFGRGIDMAWAWGEVLDEREFTELLEGYQGRVFRPAAGKSRTVLQVPCRGSWASIERRYRAFGERFHGKGKEVCFRKPPAPVFKLVSYDSPPVRLLYRLMEPTVPDVFAPWPLVRASELVVRLRDGAVERLKKALPVRATDIERVLVGRKPDGTNNGPVEDRVRIIPLPSIGHYHADREIRRVLIEVPPTCRLDARDVRWVFSGLDVVVRETGEIRAVLISADDEGFLRHYGVDREYRVWRTVTPAALPEAARRRISPARALQKAKAGDERSSELLRAAVAVRQALRHAEFRKAVESIRVQREPFEGKGARVEPFAEGTRFDKHRLWHVEIVFKEPVPGPLVIGDGRFLGLGVMAPFGADTHFVTGQFQPS